MQAWCSNMRVGHISKPAAEGALVAALEGLIRGASIQQTEISPLLVEQRKIGDARSHWTETAPRRLPQSLWGVDYVR